MEKTWKELAGFSSDRAGKEMSRMSKEQPDLLAFLMGSTDDLAQEARELAVYIAFAVYRMFQTSSAGIKRIPSKEIADCFNRNEGLLKSPEGAPEKFSGIGLTVPASRYAVRVEALTEEPEEPGLKPLSNGDKLLLFLVLKTVVELLDKKTLAKL
ncbi:MAG: hypothetical protein M1510_12475 [Nitrospirae bacterium]|nr:hypothetical protein [Nitrospirota bacterium]